MLVQRALCYNDNGNNTYITIGDIVQVEYYYENADKRNIIVGRVANILNDALIIDHSATYLSQTMEIPLNQIHRIINNRNQSSPLPL